MTKLIKIELVLENCETLAYDDNSFYYCNLKGVSEGFNTYSNGTFKSKRLESFTLALKSHAVPTDDSLYFEVESNNDRLKHCDVTQVILHYDNEIEEDFAVMGWGSSNYTRHEGQNFKVLPNGNFLFDSNYEYTLDEYESILNWIY